MAKKLSIIVPVYKVEQYLDKCLSSILNQIIERNNIELVVVNDGSPDNSQEIIDKYVSIYPQVVVPIRQQNQGLSMARNNGLEKASGDYVWFVDSDDWLIEDALSRVFREIDKEPDADVFASFLKEFYEDDQTYKVRDYAGQLKFSGFEYLKKRLPMGAIQRFIYKKVFLIDNHLRFIPGILHEDGVFGYMMLYKANMVKIIDTPVYVYRLRSAGSIMSTITVRSAYDLTTAHKTLMGWMDKNVIDADKPMFQYLTFGLIKSLLNFCKNIIKTEEYRNYLIENKSYIKKQSIIVSKIKRTDISPFIISISPNLFSFLCRLLNK